MNKISINKIKLCVSVRIIDPPVSPLRAAGTPHPHRVLGVQGGVLALKRAPLCERRPMHQSSLSSQYKLQRIRKETVEQGETARCRTIFLALMHIDLYWLGRMILETFPDHNVLHIPHTGYAQKERATRMVPPSLAIRIGRRRWRLPGPVRDAKPAEGRRPCMRWRCPAAARLLPPGRP